MVPSLAADACFEPCLSITAGVSSVLSQSSILGQNPKIGCQEFNDLQTPKLSKKQLCDRAPWCRVSRVARCRGGLLDHHAPPAAPEIPPDVRAAKASSSHCMKVTTPPRSHL